MGRSNAIPLTEDLIGKVCVAVVKGNFRYTAFALYGVGVNTWKEWIAIGNALRNDKPTRRAVSAAHGELCRQLAIRIEQCEALLEDQLIMDIAGGSNDDKKWYLERRHNKRYTKNPNAHLDDSTGEEYSIDPIELLREKLTALTNRPDPLALKPPDDIT